MSKIPGYGLFLLVVLVAGMFIIGGTQVVHANDDDDAEAGQGEIYSAADKQAAIQAANEAILLLPDPRYIVHVRQSAVRQVAVARSLVDTAMGDYGAVEGDFADFQRMRRAEDKVLMLLAIYDAQTAIDKLPPIDQITAEDRALVEEARRLIDLAIEEYGATRYDICWWYDILREAEEAIRRENEEYNDEIDVPDEEEPDNDEDVIDNDEPEKPAPPPEEPDRPTPPTGGYSMVVVGGLLFAGAGLLLGGRRKGLKRS